MNLPKIFDEYERRARLYPALIILLPIIFALYAWFPELRTIGKSLVGFFVSFGILSLLSGISRNSGKQKEKKLFEQWGGMPTTLFLRHSDTNLDSVTKKRYYDFLQKSISNLVVPTIEDEIREVSKSDAVYESSIRWLREKTRDKKEYPLIFKDNVNYGFARNLWAMKQIGLTLVLLTFVIQIVGIYSEYSLNIKILPIEIIVSVILMLLLIFVWIFKVTSNWVRNSAEAYARSLLAACESN